MSRIQKITITNFKAIQSFEADFNGCSAIVVAGNNKGKTSLLRGIADRIRFVRPHVMVTVGETAGNGELTLTTGERFVWDFNTSGKDTLHYYSDKGAKSTVTKEFGKTFFPPSFDIDKFLNSQPKEQKKLLQEILGVDFADIDKRYSEAYTDRENKNRDERTAKMKLPIVVPAKVESVDLTDLQNSKEAERTRLNDLYLKNKSDNDAARKLWEASKKEIDKKAEEFNAKEAQKVVDYNSCQSAIAILGNHGFKHADLEEWFIDLSKLLQKQLVAQELYAPEPQYIPEKPDSTILDAIDTNILTAVKTNGDALLYSNYLKSKKEYDQLLLLANEADTKLKSIELERKNLIESVKLPTGMAFTDDGITIDGLPFNNNQISASKKYIAALKLGSLNLGEVKALHFDASYLDRDSLSEIQEWAAENNLQLLIERPDFDGGEMKYEIIENL